MTLLLGYNLDIAYRTNKCMPVNTPVLLAFLQRAWCFLSWREGNKGLLWCAQTLKGGSFSCLVAQPPSHRHGEGDTVLLDHGQWILQSSFWQVSFCLWKTPSAGLQAVMSKDRLAPTAKQCPCQSADSWRASAASPKRANILKLKPVLPKAATQSLRCSCLLPWGSHLSELALEPKGSCKFAFHSLNWLVKESQQLWRCPGVGH